MNTVIAFVQPAKVDRAEEDVPGAIGEWFEADWELLQDVRDIDASRVPAYAAVCGDAAGFEMSGGLDGGDVFGVRSRRRFVELSGSLLSDCFVRSVVVESVSEFVEASLLGGEV